MNIRTLIVILIGFMVWSCSKQNTSSALLEYSENINQQDLQKKVIEKYWDGTEKAVIYFPKGQLETNIVKEVHFYENGTVQVEGTLKDKKRHGAWHFYHKNGKTWSQGIFENGQSVGCFEVFNPDGSLKLKSYYEKGVKVKEEYFENNKLTQSVNLKERRKQNNLQNE